MSEAKKILYVVLTGEYSSTCINGVFDSKKMAEDTMKALGGRIQEYEANAAYEKPPELVPFHVYKKASIFRPGYKNPIPEQFEVSRLERDSEWELADDSSWEVCFDEGHGHEWRIYAYVWAKDEEHAAKIFQETLSQILAGQRMVKGIADGDLRMYRYDGKQFVADSVESKIQEGVSE